MYYSFRKSETDLGLFLESLNAAGSVQENPSEIKTELRCKNFYPNIIASKVLEKISVFMTVAGREYFKWPRRESLTIGRYGYMSLN